MKNTFLAVLALGVIASLYVILEGGDVPLQSNVVLHARESVAQKQEQKQEKQDAYLQEDYERKADWYAERARSASDIQKKELYLIREQRYREAASQL